MNILICLDDIKGDYTRHLLVSLLSLFETNRNHKFTIYVMSSFLSLENQHNIERVVLGNGSTVKFIISKDIIPVNIKKVLINKRKELTYATFYRLFFTYHINDNIDRILYIDCDTLVNKDLWHIYNQNFDQYIIIGSHDVNWMRYYKDKTLGIKNYINAGVLLIDVVAFKKIDLLREIEKVHISHNKSNITSDDQDYINLIFHGKIKIVSSTFNCIINRSFGIDYRKAYIIHTTNKPFGLFARVPKYIQQRYNQLLAKTPFSEFLNDNQQKTGFRYILIYIYDLLRDGMIFFAGTIGGGFAEYYIIQLMSIPIAILKTIKKSGK